MTGYLGANDIVCESVVNRDAMKIAFMMSTVTGIFRFLIIKMGMYR